MAASIAYHNKKLHQTQLNLTQFMQDVSLASDSCYFSTSLNERLVFLPLSLQEIADASNMATCIPNVAALTAAKVPMLCYRENMEKKLTWAQMHITEN